MCVCVSAMKQIDLGPGHYRRLGSTPKPDLDRRHRFFLRAAVPLAMYIATALQFTRNGLTFGGNWLLIVLFVVWPAIPFAVAYWLAVERHEN